ncbi:TPA: ImmA/IrrE family metallo-endopeptidase [Stenotrophomonas maltophilia]
MLLSDDDVIRCLEKARELIEVYETYVRAADASARSMDDMVWVARDYLNKRVEIHDLDVIADDKIIRGVFAAFDDGHYEIFLLAELGERERRFVLTKEMMHVLLDEERCRNMDIYEHVQEATSSFTIEDSNPDSPVATELLAEVAAMEFLLPYSKRKAIIEHCDGDPDYALFARRYGIPQSYVEEYLSDRMMAEFEKIED